MRTSFTEEQLRDPEVAEAKGILETCVHYGFCTNACPTYVLTRDENESPRGRIDLIRAMLEKGGPPRPETVRYLDNCLSCLSCMSTCAVKVDYVHLIDHARVHIERHHRRPWPDRLLRWGLAAILTRPRLFGAVLGFSRMMRPLKALAPGRARTLLDMVPGDSKTDFLAPAVLAAEGPRRKRVAVLPGCAQQALDGNINAATLRVLRRHGCEVVIAAGAGCCGSLPLHMGKDGPARALAKRNILAWSAEKERHGLDAVIVNASGCGTTVKDYGHLFAQDASMRAKAAEIGALARDISEFLMELQPDFAGKKPAHRVAYHDPCSMQHGQKVTREPRALLRGAGFTVLDVPEGHFCCGSAGTYNLLKPATAALLGKRKAGHIVSTGPDIIATGNIGCMVQLKAYSRLPVVHTVELIDWATGGPMPSALAGVDLPERVAAETIAALPAPRDDGDPNAVW